MAEPTLRLTFNDLILRTAEFLGIALYGTDGDEAAQIPTNVHDLELCKRLVNDGYRRFYNSHPSWNWTNQLFSITFDPAADTDKVVDGDASRYYMPDGFYGQMLSPFTYAENTGYQEIYEAPEHVIRARFAQSTVNGYPTEYALRPLHDDDKRRWEVVFWPRPHSDHVVTARCRIYPNKLLELADVPNAGLQFDEAILAACLAEAERQRDNAVGVQAAHWTEVLTRAVATDQQTTTKNLGDYGGGNPRVPVRFYDGVDGYHVGGVNAGNYREF